MIPSTDNVCHSRSSSSAWRKSRAEWQKLTAIDPKRDGRTPQSTVKRPGQMPIFGQCCNLLLGKELRATNSLFTPDSQDLNMEFGEFL
jgi:hypothetical protein